MSVRPERPSRKVPALVSMSLAEELSDADPHGPEVMADLLERLSQVHDDPRVAVTLLHPEERGELLATHPGFREAPHQPRGAEDLLLAEAERIWRELGHEDDSGDPDFQDPLSRPASPGAVPATLPLVSPARPVPAPAPVASRPPDQAMSRVMRLETKVEDLTSAIESLVRAQVPRVAAPPVRPLSPQADLATVLEKLVSRLDRESGAAPADREPPVSRMETLVGSRSSASTRARESAPAPSAAPVVPRPPLPAAPGNVPSEARPSVIQDAAAPQWLRQAPAAGIIRSLEGRSLARSTVEDKARMAPDFLDKALGSGLSVRAYVQSDPKGMTIKEGRNRDEAESLTRALDLLLTSLGPEICWNLPAVELIVRRLAVLQFAEAVAKEASNSSALTPAQKSAVRTERWDAASMRFGDVEHFDVERHARKSLVESTRLSTYVRRAAGGTSRNAGAFESEDN